MSTIVLRSLSTGLSPGASTKNASLTHLEVDENFNNLNNTKLEKSSNLSDVANAATARSNIGANNASNLTTGTIASSILGNSALFVGTTAIALNRTSGNQALTGITSLSMPGSNSGTLVLQPASVAGTTTVTIPATTGTLYVSSGMDVSLADGGTGASLAGVSGGVVYSTANSMAITAAGTAGQLLASSGSGAPTWINPQSYVTISASTANSTLYPLLVGSTGTLATANVVSANNPLTYNPSTGALNATSFVGNGSQLTGIDRYPPQAGNSGRYLTTDGTSTSWSRVFGTFVYTLKTSSYTAAAFDYILADTTAGSFTITLPASPAEGTVVQIFDHAGTFALFNLLIDRNGQSIEGQNTDLVLKQPNTEILLVFLGGTWRTYVSYQERSSILSPALVGPNAADEYSTITVQITNYNAGATYAISATGGTFTRTRNFVYWTLPAVTTLSQTHTLMVVANTVAGSTSATHNVSVQNTVVVVDQPSIIITNYSQSSSSTGWSVY